MKHFDIGLIISKHFRNLKGNKKIMSRSTLSITDLCSGFSSPYSSRHAAKIFPELARWKTTNCKTNLFSCINPFIAQKCLIARMEPRLWSHFWHNQFWKITCPVNSCTTHVPSLWNIVKALSLFVLSYVATKLRSSREEWEVRAIKLHFLAPEWKLL